MAMRVKKSPGRAAETYRGYSRIARCPQCGRQQAIVAGERECVQCQAASFRRAQQVRVTDTPSQVTN